MNDEFVGLLVGLFLFSIFSFAEYKYWTYKSPTESEILQGQKNDVIDCKNYYLKLGTLKFSYNRQTYCTCNFGK